jgi:outer membrane biosynthesis protein TonB
MPALMWAAAAAVAALLVGDAALASADPPPEPTPSPTPTASPTPTPTPTPTETPELPFPTPTPTPSGTTIYVITVTTTTTAINAPITWVAAPITTNVTNTSSGTTNSSTVGGGGTTPATLSQRGSGRSAKLEVNLTGCGGALPKSTRRKSSAALRLPQSGTLLLRVNGKKVGSIQLASSERGVPLRIMISKSGMLTVRRPSGSVLSLLACTPSSSTKGKS